MMPTQARQRIGAKKVLSSAKSEKATAQVVTVGLAVDVIVGVAVETSAVRATTVSVPGVEVAEAREVVVAVEVEAAGGVGVALLVAQVE
jgi:hypothetical protein